ncbi:ABC transporter ATP-binding protein [Georgenia alba]|uniref:ABC transporter ATP-binding protein n=1 Tax=Georgenia alba TaxID=2233858 RepID=A0ABW2Q3I3_9MICO
MARQARFETLELRGVGRTYGSQVALTGLDLTVRAGEFIALLGPSGCGKSTALNCLAGLIPLTDGQILVDGARVDTEPAERRDFGMVFQNYALFPHMSVWKNVSFGLEMHKVPRRDITPRVERALDLVHLREHARKLPAQLSGGQQQRVAIARVIALEPRLVLMDEPLSNLDAKLRLEMRTEIRRLHQELGLTTIYVTHDQEEALSMADRLVVLRDGRVQQVGTPEELHDEPANWHVADFMGFRNLLEATVEAVRDDGVVVAAGDIRLTGRALEEVTAGGRARVAIRPDDLRIAGPDEEPAENRVRAVVRVVEYRGREFALEATLGERVLHVRSAVAPAVGETVELAVDPSRALVYRDEGQPSQVEEALAEATA